MLLLYCLFQRSHQTDPELPSGQDNTRLTIVDLNDLSAVLSDSSPNKLSFEPASLLAFHRVVQAVHVSPSVQGVIPMRYGSLFENSRKFKQYINDHHSHWMRVMARIQGCSEMGLRIVSHEAHQFPRQTRPSPDPASCASGTDFLKARKDQYAQQDGLSQDVQAVIETCAQTFANLCTSWKSESGIRSTTHRDQSVKLPSVNFLVPTQSVEAFVDRFHQLEEGVQSKLFLSGPWPPYNFVNPLQ